MNRRELVKRLLALTAVVLGAPIAKLLVKEHSYIRPVMLDSVLMKSPLFITYGVYTKSKNSEDSLLRSQSENLEWILERHDKSTTESVKLNQVPQVSQDIDLVHMPRTQS